MRACSWSTSCLTKQPRRPGSNPVNKRHHKFSFRHGIKTANLRNTKHPCNDPTRYIKDEKQTRLNRSCPAWSYDWWGKSSQNMLHGLPDLKIISIKGLWYNHIIIGSEAHTLIQWFLYKWWLKSKSMCLAALNVYNIWHVKNIPNTFTLWCDVKHRFNRTSFHAKRLLRT